LKKKKMILKMTYKNMKLILNHNKDYMKPLLLNMKLKSKTLLKLSKLFKMLKLF